MSIIVFAFALVALVIVPQQARRAAAAITTETSVRADTEPMASLLVSAERQVAAAESVLAVARLAAARQSGVTLLAGADPAVATSNVPDTLSSAARSRRDTLSNLISQLGRLITRSENAPLLGSYRALAQAPAMQGEVKVRQLLDSLVEIERERDSYSAVGGVDPVFVALTAHANELGRSIESLAEARRTTLKHDLAMLAPAASTTNVNVPRATLDTTMRARERDVARARVSSAATQLARARADLIRRDDRDERARELANVGASPLAMLGAAFVFAVIFGFGAALLDEVRHPRIANAREVERATGTRVLGVIRPLSPSPERGRRGAEVIGPAYVDPGADGHQLIYQAIATAGVGTIMLTIAGDDAGVSAVVAINFAAIASDEARATVLIDTDALASPVMAALRLRPGAGIAEASQGTALLGEVTRVAQIGRDRSVDVIPSGAETQPTVKIAAYLGEAARRLTRQYDAIIVVSSLTQVMEGMAASLPIPDVIVCARTGRTTIDEVVRTVQAITDRGAQIRGLVLWDAKDPILLELRSAAKPILRDAAVA